MSGFDAVADDLAQLERVRILVGRTDRQVFEEVAVGLQQVDALGVRKQMDEVVRRSDRSAIAQDSVEKISQGVSTLPQNSETEAAVGKLREMVASGQVRVRTYVESPLHAKAYLCWYDDHARARVGGRWVVEFHAGWFHREYRVECPGHWRCRDV